MRARFATSVLLLGLLLLPAAASAGVEVTLAGGYSWGATSFLVEGPPNPLIFCITTPCVLAEASTDQGQAHPTVILGVPIARNWMVEALLNRQEGDLRLTSPFELEGRETYQADTAQVGLQRRWDEGPGRPFAAAAVGLTRFKSSALAYDRPIFPGIIATPVDEDAFSGSLAGGFRPSLSRHLALRLEGRVYWHYLSERLGGTLRQTEANVGLTYRW